MLIQIAMMFNLFIFRQENKESCLQWKATEKWEKTNSKKKVKIILPQFTK